MIDYRWVDQQLDVTIAQWDQTLNERYPDTRAWSNAPTEYVTHLTDTCNYLNAVKRLDIGAYLKPHATVLDLACGGGWLTAYLSTLQQIDRIYAVDSSRKYLSILLPAVVAIMHGEQRKVVSVEGLFTPILLPDESLDAVLASSALHHADNLETALREIRRVLRKDGLVFILNETPMTSLRHLLAVAKATLKTFAALTRQDYNSNPRAISSGAYLVEPYLGDRCYPPWYWKEAIRRAGFEIECILDSGFPTMAGGSLHLTHFIGKAR